MKRCRELLKKIIKISFEKENNQILIIIFTQIKKKIRIISCGRYLFGTRKKYTIKLRNFYLLIVFFLNARLYQISKTVDSKKIFYIFCNKELSTTLFFNCFGLRNVTSLKKIAFFILFPYV